MDTKKVLLSATSLLPIWCMCQELPNVIIIFSDDQGYQDLGCYGSPDILTPNIDRIANEGLKLTSFYVSASVSSASRAGLMAGRLNTHNGVTGVLWPDSKGLPLSETTMAEALKDMQLPVSESGIWGIWKDIFLLTVGLMNILVYHIVTICFWGQRMNSQIM